MIRLAVRAVAWLAVAALALAAVAAHPAPATGGAAACPSPSPPKVVLTVGDSITLGATMAGPSDSYRAELGRLLDAACIPHQFVMAAEGGVTCGYWSSRIAGLMTTVRPDVVLINCGTNDRLDNRTAAQITAWEGAYRALFDTIMDMDPDVIAYPAWVQYSAGRPSDGCTTPPGPSPDWLPISEAAVNDAIFRAMVGVIDEWGRRVPAIIDYQSIPEGYLDECGVHPTRGGYDVMGRLAYNTIAPRLVAPPAAALPCGLTGRRPGRSVGTWIPCQRMAVN